MINDTASGRVWLPGKQILPRIVPLFQQHAVGEVRRDQIKLLAFTIRLFAMVGISSVILLAADFRAGLGPGGTFLCGIIPLMYLLLLAHELQWRRDGDDDLFLKRTLLGLGLLGVLWGILINILMLSADLPQQRLLIAVMIGVVSTPLVAVPLSAALTFWLPSSIAGFIMISELRTFDLYLLLCYCGYLNFTFMAVLICNKFMLERSVGRVKLVSQDETISVFLKDHVENGSDWLWETDTNLNLQSVSRRLAEVVRLPQSYLEGFPLLGLMNSGGTGPEEGSFERLLRERAPFRNLLQRAIVDGDERWWSMTGQAKIGSGGQFQGYRGIGSDVTETYRSDERVRRLAMYDSLTGLANRQHFIDSFAGLCGAETGAGRTGVPAQQRPGGHRVAVLLLDLDKFKSVNDNFGHAVGDALLVAVADRLRRCLREATVVARLGGDEFAIHSVVEDDAQAVLIAERIINALNDSYVIAANNLTIGVSIGISFLEHDEDIPGDCLRRADLALYAAKSAGQGVYRFFHSDLKTEHHDRLALQVELRSAIRHGGLSLAYQPIFDIRSDLITSVEALCRWTHPTLGPIAPSLFISLAEETGLIVELGEWVLAEACAVAATWPEHVRMAVNVSALQIHSPGFAAAVARILSEAGLAPVRIEFELTENVYLQGSEQTLETLRALRDAGSRLILDDFGTGYSSLSYLTSFECDGIKIDRSFISDFEGNMVKAAILSAVAQLASDLSLTVIVEGVETSWQWEILHSYNITGVQGYFLGMPVPVQAIGEVLVHRHPVGQSMV